MEFVLALLNRGELEDWVGIPPLKTVACELFAATGVVGGTGVLKMAGETEGLVAGQGLTCGEWGRCFLMISWYTRHPL